MDCVGNLAPSDPVDNIDISDPVRQIAVINYNHVLPLYSLLHRLLLFDFSKCPKGVCFFYPYRKDNSIPAGINHYDVTVGLVIAAEKREFGSAGLLDVRRL